MLMEVFGEEAYKPANPLAEEWGLANQIFSQNGDSNRLGEALESIDGSVNADSVCATIGRCQVVCVCVSL